MDDDDVISLSSDTDAEGGGTSADSEGVISVFSDDDDEDIAGLILHDGVDHGSTPSSTQTPNSGSTHEAVRSSASEILEQSKQFNTSSTLTSPRTLQEDLQQLFEGGVPRESRSFFEELGTILLRDPVHWWCRYIDAMTEMLFSLGSLEEELDDAWGDNSDSTTVLPLVWEVADAQLGVCRRCIRRYYEVKEIALQRLTDDEDGARPEVVLAEQLQARESRRLEKAFMTVTASTSRAGTGVRLGSGTPGSAQAEGVGDGIANEDASLETMAVHAFWEMLSYPSLLLMAAGGGGGGALRLEKAFRKALSEVNGIGNSECFIGRGWNRHWPGVFALLVNRDPEARAWAQSMARRAGPVGVSVYRESLSFIMDKWVPVIELGLFQNGDDPISDAMGEAVCEHRHRHVGESRVAGEVGHLQEGRASKQLQLDFSGADGGRGGGLGGKG
ncbi:unnamed protein product, partial [Choristocarpus tenellus]